MKKNIVISILTLVFIGVVLLLDLPAYNKFILLNKEIETQEQLLENKKAVIAEVEQSKQDYDTYKDSLKKVGYVLPPEKEIPNLIVQFEALTSENGLILEALSFAEEAINEKKEKETKPYKSLDVSLSVSGSYKSFTSFLEALELNVRLMDVKLISFSANKKNPSLFTFDIELEVYYLPAGPLRSEASKAGQ